MKKKTNGAIKRGFGFGLTSGVITTLGLIIGLYASTHSKMLVIGGILMIAVADSMSDALGMHISEEFQGGSSVKEVWVATASTFLFKFIFALSFVLWFLIFNLSTAIIVSIIWGIFIIVFFSYYLARLQKVSVFRVIMEHMTIMMAVIIITYFVGNFISRVFV